MKKSKARFWIFLAPALISFSLVVLIPMLIGFFYAFTDWNGIVGSEITFVGFRNFIEIFTRDSSFMHAFGFTALFSICAVVLVNIVGFALALLVTQKFRGATLLRGIFFMPNLIGGLLLGFTWQFIFVSIFGAISKATGWQALNGWLADPVRICGTSDSDCMAAIRLYDDCVYRADSADSRVRERGGPYRRRRLQGYVKEHYHAAYDAGFYDRPVLIHLQLV